MRFYPRKAPRKKADILVDKLASGKCDDLVVSELRVAAAEISDPEELQRISWAILDIAMNSASHAAVTYALKSIMIFLPMGEDIENALDKRVLMLVEDKSAVSNKPLIEAIANYTRERASGDIDRSITFIPALLLFLEECNSTAAVISYEVLMSVAATRPEFFEPHTGLLTRELGSINNSTRVYTARIITKLATTHPEYMVEAEKTLLHISTFYPDAEVKSAAAEAYQTITNGRVELQPEPDLSPQQKHDSTGGLADIMRKKASARDKKQSTDSRIDNRLLSLAANFGRKSDIRNVQAYGRGSSRENDDHQAHDTDNEAMDKIIDDFSEIAGVITGNRDDEDEADGPEEEKFSKEEAELRDMVAKVQMDFSESAESLLDSLGMKHLHRDQQNDAPADAVNAGMEPAMAEPETEPAGATSLETPVAEKEQPVQTLETVADTLPPAETVTAIPDITEAVTAIPDMIVAAPPAIDTASDDHHGFISPVETTMISEPGTDTAETSQTAEPQVLASPEPLLPEAINENVAGAVMTEPAENVPDPVVTEADQVVPDAVIPEKAQETEEMPPRNESAEVVPAFVAEKEISGSAAKSIKSPILPAGVRMSAVKFKTLDQSKKQPSSVVSIRPHIKPLNRTPRDISNTAQRMQAGAAAAAAHQADMKSAADAAAGEANLKAAQQQQQLVAESPTNELAACPSCNEKVAPDQTVCLKCGTDLKSQKVRCPRCTQINARETSTCVRCGARLLKSPAAVKQPDIL